MKYIAILVLVIIAPSLQTGIDNTQNANLDNMRIVNTVEYTLEDHTVHTTDGYILNLRRIGNSGPPVLIMHGLLGSSQDFVMFGNDKSLAYSLADQGYDIWLGNNRGNTFSRKHENLSVVEESFWEFSFHEMGYFDCPALVDYILSNTSQSSLTFIGHAQGATQSLVMLATRPDYRSKVNQIIAFAPFTYMSHIPHPILQFLKNQFSLLQIILSRFKIYELLPHSEDISKILKMICGTPAISKYCSLVPYILGGMDPQALDLTIPPAFFDVFPAGTSVKNILHLFQQIKTGHFQQYDYGLIGNINKYKNTVPPLYNLTNIRIPVNIFYSKNDWLASDKDMGRLAQDLPICEKYVIKSKYFNHYDFFMGKNLKSLLHFDVINLVNKGHRIPEITTPSTTTTVIVTPSTREPSSRPVTSATSYETSPPSIKTTSTNKPTPTNRPTPTNKPTPKPNSADSIKNFLFIYLIGIIVVSHM